MKDLDRESDADLPPNGADLGRWRFFIFGLLGGDSAAFAYLDHLCTMFGPDYSVDLAPDLFLDHIARVAFTNDREAA